MFDSDNNSGFIDGDGNIANRFADIALLSPTKNGYTELYKAKRYGQWFVLKRLTNDATADQGCKNLLQKEFLIGSSLDHPHIGKTISMECVEGLGECVVEEYVDGMDWDCFFGEGRPSRKETLRIIGELCDALRYLHSKQLVHRDLKPSNVLITHNGHHVKLIDFGLADSDSFDLLKRVNGTRRYAAPELSDGGTADFRCDIYSLGVMLGELEMSWPRLHRVARRCRNENPAKRYASVAEVPAALKSSKRPYIATLVLAVVSVAAVIVLLAKRGNDTINSQLSPTDSTQTQTATVSKHIHTSPVHADKTTYYDYSNYSEKLVTYTENGNGSTDETMAPSTVNLDNIAKVEASKYIAQHSLRPAENTIKGWQTLLKSESSRMNAAAARSLASQVAQNASAPTSKIEQLTETIYECFFDTLAGLHQLALRTVPPGTFGTGLYGVRHELKGHTFYFTEEEINQAYWVDGDGAELKRKLMQRLKNDGWPDNATQAANYDFIYAQQLNMIRNHLPECQKKLDAMTFEERYLFQAKWFHELKADESVTHKSQNEQLMFLKGLFE